MKKYIVFILLFLLAGCATVQQRRDKFVQAHPGLTEEQREAIGSGKLIAGMTPEMVRATWGEPLDEINEVVRGRSVTSWLFQEYEGSFVNTYRVSFVNGKVRDVRLIKAREQIHRPYSRDHYRRGRYYPWVYPPMP